MVSKAENQHSFFESVNNGKESKEQHCLWSSDYHIKSRHSDFNLKIDRLVANVTRFIVERSFCFLLPFFGDAISEYHGCMTRNLLDFFFS